MGGGKGGGSKGGGGSKKKDSKITKRNISRFGESHVRSLQQKQKDFKSVRAGTMTRSSFAGKHYGKGYGTTGNVGRSLQTRPETAKEVAKVQAKQEAEAKKQRQFGADRLSNTSLGLGSVNFDSSKANDSMASFAYNNPFTGQSFLAGGYNQPGRLGGWFDKGLNKRVPYEANASFGRLFKDDMSQLGKFTNKHGKVEGGLFNTGIPKNLNQVKQLFSGKGGLGFSFGSGFGTGPTPLGRQAVRRFLPFASQIDLGKQIFNEGATGSATTNLMNNINTSVTNLTGGRLTANNPETDIGARAWRGITSIPDRVSDLFSGDDTKVASSDTSGLNIGSVDSGETTEGSKTGRTIGKSISDFGKTAFAFGTDVFNQAFSPSLADGTLIGNTDFAGRLPGDKNFANRDVQIKSAYNNAMNSNLVQQLGENIGLPKNWKIQTQDALSALGENYQGATADRDGIYKGTSETLKNLTLDKRLSPLSGYLAQLATENPNVSDADRNKNYNLFGIKTPVTNETVADIVSGFQPDAEKITGLSSEERGAVEGGGGNRLISGKLTDIAREALTGNIGTGKSLGLSTGSPLTIGNMVDASKLIANNYNTEGTLAQQRSAEIGNLVSGGDVTKGSIIRSILPFPTRGGGGSTRSGSTPNKSSGTAPTTIPPILPIPPSQTVQPQTGQTPANLSQLQQQAYNRQMAIYGSPNYSPQINPLTRGIPRSFRAYFNRNYRV